MQYVTDYLPIWQNVNYFFIVKKKKPSSLLLLITGDHCYSDPAGPKTWGLIANFHLCLSILSILLFSTLWSSYTPECYSAVCWTPAQTY